MSEIIDFKDKRSKAVLSKCQAQPGGATIITYRGASVCAPNNHIQEALIELSKNESVRKNIMESVNKYLERNFKKVINGTATQEIVMNVSQDIAIWYANEILIGKVEV